MRSRRRWLTASTLILSDTLFALVIWWGASELHALWGRGDLLGVSAASIVPNTLIWIGMRLLLGLYPGYGLDAVEALRRQTYAVLATLAMTSVFALAFQIGDSLSRLLLGLGFLILLLVAPLVRYLAKLSMRALGMWGKPVVILGAGETGAQLLRVLHREWGLGFVPVAVFDFHQAPAGGVLEGVPYGGTIVDATDMARTVGVDTAIFAMPQLSQEYLNRFVETMSHNFQHVILIPNLVGITSSAVAARNFAGVFGVEMKHNLLNLWALRAKRVLDLGAAIVGGVMLSPLILLLALLVWLGSGGPVFYKAQRIGRDGRVFSCIKYRTMVTDAEDVLQQLLEENVELREEYSKYHKLRQDPRVTLIGSFLRKTSLDELPQLWNVLRGDMSLVGPRPYLPRESVKLGAARSEILRVLPGITGLWQVNGRSFASFEERVQMDTHYIRNWSVWLDLVILARTIEGVGLRRGAA